MISCAVIDRLKNVKIGLLITHGFLDVRAKYYENYSIKELVDEFAEVIPTFFKSFDHLLQQCKEEPETTSIQLMHLISDLLEPPTASCSVQIACIIHSFLHHLTWK